MYILIWILWLVCNTAPPTPTLRCMRYRKLRRAALALATPSNQPTRTASNAWPWTGTSSTAAPGTSTSRSGTWAANSSYRCPHPRGYFSPHILRTRGPVAARSAFKSGPLNMKNKMKKNESTIKNICIWSFFYSVFRVTWIIKLYTVRLQRHIYCNAFINFSGY